MKRWHVVHLAAALTLAIGALTLTACGGGGGGGGGDSEEPTARPLMALNADNAPGTVRDVFMVLAGGTDILSDDILSDDLLPQSVDATAGGGDAGSGPLETVQDVTRLVRGKLDAGTSVSALSGDRGDRTTAQETFPCESGTFSVSETSTSASIAFNDCVESEDGQWVRLNGGLDITNIVETVDACIDDFRASLRFRNLTVETYTDLTQPPVESVSIDGRANVEEVLDICTEPASDWFRMSGDYLKFVVDGDSVAYFAFDLRTEEFWEEFQGDGYFEYDFTATLDISTLPGSIDVTTIKLLVRNSSDDYPNGGELRLDAANNGYLGMIINSAVPDDPNAVSIQADFNGDGFEDCEEVNVSWEELEEAAWICEPPKPEL
jgi:hypothetical protein